MAGHTANMYKKNGKQRQVVLLVTEAELKLHSGWPATLGASKAHLDLEVRTNQGEHKAFKVLQQGHSWTESIHARLRGRHHAVKAAKPQNVATQCRSSALNTRRTWTR